MCTVGTRLYQRLHPSLYWLCSRQSWSLTLELQSHSSHHVWEEKYICVCMCMCDLFLWVKGFLGMRLQRPKRRAVVEEFKYLEGRGVSGQSEGSWMMGTQPEPDGSPQLRGASHPRTQLQAWLNRKYDGWSACHWLPQSTTFLAMSFECPQALHSCLKAAESSVRCVNI